MLCQLFLCSESYTHTLHTSLGTLKSCCQRQLPLTITNIRLQYTVVFISVIGFPRKTMQKIKIRTQNNYFLWNWNKWTNQNQTSSLCKKFQNNLSIKLTFAFIDNANNPLRPMLQIMLKVPNISTSSFFSFSRSKISKIETTKHFFLSYSKPISDLLDFVELTCVVQTNKTIEKMYFSYTLIFTIFRFSFWIQHSFYIICVSWKPNQNIFFIKNIKAWKILTQPTFTCSKLITETLEWDMTYVQN